MDVARPYKATESGGLHGPVFEVICDRFVENQVFPEEVWIANQLHNGLRKFRKREKAGKETKSPDKVGGQPGL